MKDKSLLTARKIMIEFANSTGLTFGEHRRYLWTDAFAVCNFLELYRRLGEDECKQLALRLVDRVNYVLGRHRGDDRRTGWISGLDEEEGRKHPTTGGLRIGKVLPERLPLEPFDEVLEWDRDGQYYHYLTKWMHALNRVSGVTGELIYNRWAMELAKTAHAAFTFTSPSGKKQMYWKMSIDLSRPLIPSMGQHDPLDGFLTYNELQASAPKDIEWPNLNAEIGEMASICEGREWTTDDPLGIGELLCDACKVAQLVRIGQFERVDLLPTLFEASIQGLNDFLRGGSLKLSAEFRLAFRELGLAIGLQAIEKLRAIIEEKPNLFAHKSLLLSQIDGLLKRAPLIKAINGFWLEQANWKTSSWEENRDINMVMLATSLAPNGYIVI